MYIYDKGLYFLSCIVHKKPELIQLYPYVEYLNYYRDSKIDLSKFDNLIRLNIRSYSYEITKTNKITENLDINAFKIFSKLRNLKILECEYCDIEDGFFDVFESLEELTIRWENKLNKPFNKNLKNLKKLTCIDCDNLNDECFDVFESLENLNCSHCRNLNRPFNNNLKTLKYLHFYHLPCSANQIDINLSLSKAKCDSCINLMHLNRIANFSIKILI